MDTPLPTDPTLRRTGSGLLTGGMLAATLSGAVLLWRGRRETGNPAAPVNAISHWLWPQQALQTDPFAGEVFVFRPRRTDRVKILVYDGTGLVLYSKRLEAGRFCGPSPADGVVRLSAAQLATLLEGLPWHRLQPRAIPRPGTAW